MSQTSKTVPVVYQYFIGIDIAKKDFVVSCSDGSNHHKFLNNSDGFEYFYSSFKAQLSHGLAILENTGGYEYSLMNFLLEKKISTHRANAYQVKSFIRSLGVRAKTDELDAKNLWKYGKERHENLALAQSSDKNFERLRSLLLRRDDLVKMQTQEKNRKQAPDAKEVSSCIDIVLKCLEEQIKSIDQKIDALTKEQADFKERAEIIRKIPGIGPQTSKFLLAFMPELGNLDRRQIASLAGVAPIARDSGAFKGYRSVFGGRQEVKKNLFLSAMSAARSKSALGDYYRSMLQRGKKKMVALTALMRKILVIANAKLRDYIKESEKNAERNMIVAA